MSYITVSQRETQTGQQEEAIEEQDDITPSVEVVVLDGPAIVHMMKPATARTFREYAQDVCLPCVRRASAG